MLTTSCQGFWVVTTTMILRKKWFWKKKLIFFHLDFEKTWTYSHQITQLAPDALSPQKPPVAALPPNHALEPFMLEHEDIVGQAVNFPHKGQKEINSPWTGTGLAAGWQQRSGTLSQSTDLQALTMQACLSCWPLASTALNDKLSEKQVCHQGREGVFIAGVQKQLMELLGCGHVGVAHD